MPARDSSDVFARRARNLCVLQPILALEANKRRVDRVDLTPFDLHYLTMALLDAVIVAMGGPTRGAKVVELVDSLRPIIEAMHPAADDAMAHAVVTYMTENLSIIGARSSFQGRHFELTESGAGRWTEFPFALLEERDVSGMEDYRFVALPEAVNLYFRALEVDLQAEEVAQAAVIRYFIEQGKWREAGDRAELASKLSIGLKNELLTLFHTLERNAVDVVYARDLAPVVEKARGHLRERRKVDYDLVTLAEENASSASSEDRVHMLRVRDNVRQVLQHHNDLDHALAGANDRFVAEQTRQRFRPSAILRFRDPQADVLRGILASPTTALSDWFAQNCHFFLPPVRRSIADLPGLIGLLMQDPRSTPEASQLDDERESEEYAAPEYFSDEEVARVEAFMAGLAAPFTFGQVLNAARDAGVSARERHLLALRLFRYFGETDERGWTAEPMGTRLRGTEVYGDDLRFNSAE